MRYRVEELAGRCGVSVDTVRYYQSRGLVPKPEREGRLAWYGAEHVAVLERVRDLKARGFTLAIIARVLAGQLDAGEEALAAALAGPLPGETDAPERTYDRAGLARATGVPMTLLEALEREGLLLAPGGGPYAESDAAAVRAGLALLDAGVPLSELLALAREHDRATKAVAVHAVDLFARYVRDPIRATTQDEDEAGQRMVAALTAMLPAATALVSHQFRQHLLAAARARLEGDAGEAVP